MTGRRHVAAAMIAGIVASGCGSDAPRPAEDDRTVQGELPVPPFIASSRAIDTGLLSVVMTVGTPPQEVVIDQRDGIYLATFTLPEGSRETFPLEILWSYAITGRADPIPIARARRDVSLADSRNLRVSDYRTDEFDLDNDLSDNFTEIDQGTDPTQAGAETPLAPNENQGDCRELLLDGERQIDIDARRDLFRFDTTPLQETRALTFEVEQLVYHATLFAEAPGTLTIEHRSGLPVNTDALIYDRVRGTESTALQERANETGGIDGIPASVSARILAPGLYCYALFDESGVDYADGAVLSDIVLDIRFAPDGA